MCFDFQEYYMHSSVIGAVAATLGVDMVVRKSEYFEHLGSGGSDWAPKCWEGSTPGLFGCQMELTPLLEASKVALSTACVKHLKVLWRAPEKED